MAPDESRKPRQGVNIDTETGFAETVSRVEAPSTRNFFVQFDASNAHCEVDLDPADIIHVITTSNPTPTTVRWLNIWSWDSNFKPAFEQITAKYAISPRLAGLIWPESPKLDLAKPDTIGTPSSVSDDLEKALPAHKAFAEHASSRADVEAFDPLSAMGLTDVLNSLWHFCSVDSDRHYRYIGCNQLYIIPGREQQRDLDKPSGVRIWTSLLLCDDGTVISVLEQPPKDMVNDASTLKVIRQNSINVFKHLSRLHMSGQSDNSLHRVTIRPELNAVNQTPSEKNLPSFVASDASGILLYYLFDDWARSFRLIAGFEHPYRKKLQHIRKEMFRSPDVDLIHSLHQVGKQLTILKLMYQSYELIIKRILYRQRISESSQRHQPTLSRLGSEQSHNWSGTGNFNAADGADLSFDDRSDTNVRLCPAAIVRFERLLDRVRLYALTEIENCLKEKDELVFMNFNLVALKESTAVEKLTRTTILLAKVTILFLPVSLMTAYFSVQVRGIENQYSPMTYWLSFLVVTFLSVALVLAFEFASYRVAGRTVYKSLTRTLWDKGKRKSC